MGKRIIITESQYQNLVQTNGFNMDEMLALRSYAARVRYCNYRLVKLGQGSSRIVYEVDSEKVLKVAKNRKGVAQNEAEGDYYLQTFQYLFPKVYEVSDDGIFLLVQRARRARAADFRRLLGYSFEVVCGWIEHVSHQYDPCKNLWWHERNCIDLFNSEQWQNMVRNETNIFTDLSEYLCNYQIRKGIGDFMRPSSWGVVNDNGREKIVLIDYGATNDVISNYYSE